MENLKKVLFYFSKYKKVIVFSFITILLILLFLVYYFSEEEKEENIISDSFENIEKEITVEEETIKEEVVYFTVDIKGEVIAPGVYTLKSGSRVIDVINMAGGYTEHANTRYINLSKKITDEMTIIIYSNYEIESFKEKEVIIEECICEEVVNDSCLENNLNESDEDKKENNGLIDLNTASLEELMTLNGIGEAKAELIIEYRENKRFESIEEIKEVNGISDNVYEKIKDFIKVS